jgi:hypothetical protein
MNRGGAVLLAGIVVCAAAFGGVYCWGTAPARRLMREEEPELAWLKAEFKLSDAEMTRITQLHEAYLPQCRERCRLVEEQNERLDHLLARAEGMTSEIREVLAERARIRAECEAEMLRHFLAVSHTMPPEQGRRYLEWVERQTILRPTAMESRHHHEGGHGSEHQAHPER